MTLAWYNIYASIEAIVFPTAKCAQNKLLTRNRLRAAHMNVSPVVFMTLTGPLRSDTKTHLLYYAVCANCLQETFREYHISCCRQRYAHRRLINPAASVCFRPAARHSN